MGKVSGIEWTDATWNPWLGCTKVSPGCRNCYAERIEERYGRDFSQVRRTAYRTFNSPMRWERPRMIFTCSMSDFFHKDADDWREEVWDIIRVTPRHTYQILTKRPERIEECLPEDWGSGWPNVWLGTSVEMPEYSGRMATLAEVPAVVRFISAEPLLGLVSIYDAFTLLVTEEDRKQPLRWQTIDWVIVGGESDPVNPRPMKVEWARLLRDECLHYGIPFFFKQWGGRSRVNGVWGGRVLDGRTWDEMPGRI